MVTPIAGTGTPEQTWEAWPAPAAWPRLSVDAVSTPLVVAPHPDDEVLGVGGLLAMLAGGVGVGVGVGVDVVVVTDGEASHPRSRAVNPDELAAIRRAETVAAGAVLGVDSSRLHYLQHPDGGIDESVLVGELCTYLVPGRWCFTTWRGDGHPDHETVGSAAADACTQTGAVLVEFPVWMWHWAEPDDPHVPWNRARRIELTGEARTAKARAVNAFRSQIRPLGPDPADAAILPPHVLARFARPYETVFVP